jgi:DNA mismatch repair protein MutL
LKRINILNETTSNKIAAGEVVERPFSVVKELIENSIDSDAKNITIEITEGGQKFIKIIDDGNGIHPDDVKLAFMPHATSKINDIDDVFHITTMGFRGEALASIAAVSNTKLMSRTKDFDYGKEIYITGGIVNYIKDCGCNPGTTIEVSDLFYNVPARQKFLKSSSREAALISEIVGKLALANPQIAFKLFSNGKNVITTYGTGKVMDVIRSLHDRNICENIVGFEKHSDTISLTGFIGTSEISRGSRNSQSVFVNKRYIKSKLITASVENAFKSFLTVNKFPFFILFVDIYPELLDVNVHPTKSEVKFQNDREVFKVIFDSVHEAVRKNLNYSFGDSEEENKNIKTIESVEEIKTIQLPIDFRNQSSLNNYNEKPDLKENSFGNFKTEEIPAHKDIYTTEPKPAANYANEDGNNRLTGTGMYDNTQKLPDNPRVLYNPKLPDLRVIGQFNQTYILAEANKELYLIDQHAAHEKILFEKFMKEISEKEVTAQILFTPLVFELSSDDFLTYSENAGIFSNVGFNIEIFGENTVSIREVPFILGNPDINSLFIDIVENLKNMGTGQAMEVKYNLIAKLACKAAIKANKFLNEAEIKALIQNLSYLEDPFNCPHGRPTIIKFNLMELEKRFKRIQ